MSNPEEEKSSETLTLGEKPSKISKISPVTPENSTNPTSNSNNSNNNCSGNNNNNNAGAGESNSSSNNLQNTNGREMIELNTSRGCVIIRNKVQNSNELRRLLMAPQILCKSGVYQPHTHCIQPGKIQQVLIAQHHHHHPAQQQQPPPQVVNYCQTANWAEPQPSYTQHHYPQETAYQYGGGGGMPSIVNNARMVNYGHGQYSHGHQQNISELLGQGQEQPQHYYQAQQGPSQQQIHHHQSHSQQTQPIQQQQQNNVSHHGIIQHSRTQEMHHCPVVQSAEEQYPQPQEQQQQSTGPYNNNNHNNQQEKVTQAQLRHQQSMQRLQQHLRQQHHQHLLSIQQQQQQQQASNSVANNSNNNNNNGHHSHQQHSSKKNQSGLSVNQLTKGIVVGDNNDIYPGGLQILWKEVPVECQQLITNEDVPETAKFRGYFTVCELIALKRILVIRLNNRDNKNISNITNNNAKVENLEET